MNKALIIGLDGMSPELLDLLIKRGIFLQIKGLKALSSYGDLESTYPPVTGPVWTSFATGVNPGKHGIFDFVQPCGNLLNLKNA